MDYRNSMSLTTMCGHEHDSYATIVSMRSPITGMSRVMEGRSISKDPRNTKRCWGLWEPYRERVPTRRGTTTPYSMTTTGGEVNRKLDRALCSVPCPQSTRGGRRRAIGSSPEVSGVVPRRIGSVHRNVLTKGTHTSTQHKYIVWYSDEEIVLSCPSPTAPTDRQLLSDFEPFHIPVYILHPARQPNPHVRPMFCPLCGIARDPALVREVNLDELNEAALRVIDLVLRASPSHDEFLGSIPSWTLQFGSKHVAKW